MYQGMIYSSIQQSQSLLLVTKCGITSGTVEMIRTHLCHIFVKCSRLGHIFSHEILLQEIRNSGRSMGIKNAVWTINARISTYVSWWDLGNTYGEWAEDYTKRNISSWGLIWITTISMQSYESQCKTSMKNKYWWLNTGLWKLQLCRKILIY